MQFLKHLNFSHSSRCSETEEMNLGLISGDSASFSLLIASSVTFFFKKKFSESYTSLH